MLEQDKRIEILLNSISRYEDYCDGYISSNNPTGNYILGTVLSVGKDKVKFSHSGSAVLDEINAFDLAESNDAYIGQLNMSIVSSFCGPQGLILGYDILGNENNFAKDNLYKTFDYKGEKINSYHVKYLSSATRSLFGTVDNQKFPLKPGSHVPFASKNIKAFGPKKLYAGVAMGIPEDREKHACLIMEDCGVLAEDKESIMDNLCKSIFQIGENQRIKYTEIFVGIKTLKIEADEVGCALVAMPYFVIAQKAITHSISEFVNISLNDWKQTHNK